MRKMSQVTFRARLFPHLEVGMRSSFQLNSPSTPSRGHEYECWSVVDPVAFDNCTITTTTVTLRSAAATASHVSTDNERTNGATAYDKNRI